MTQVPSPFDVIEEAKRRVAARGPSYSPGAQATILNYFAIWQRVDGSWEERAQAAFAQVTADISNRTAREKADLIERCRSAQTLINDAILWLYGTAR